MYTHMPFFINKTEGLFCVSGNCDSTPEEEYMPVVKYRPWRAVYGSLESYDYLDFPYQPQSHMQVHCSPILHNNIYSVSYGKKIYNKKANEKWAESSFYAWQGYHDGEDFNYTNTNRCFINSKELFLPFFDIIYRICPYDGKYIMTGAINKKRKSVFYDGEKFAEIKSKGESVYKCNIIDNILFYGAPDNLTDIEPYHIYQSTDFIFDYNSDLFDI